MYNHNNCTIPQIRNQNPNLNPNQSLSPNLGLNPSLNRNLYTTN